MRPVLTKAFADVRRHRLQTLVVFVIAALAITVGAMGGTLLVQTSSPYDHAFADLAGPHLVAVFDARKVTSNQVAATAGLAGVTATGGPWVAAEVPFEKGGTHLTATASFSQKATLTVLGRDDPGGSLDRLEVVSGRWVRGPGEIVVTRSFAIGRAVLVGDRITALGTSDKSLLTVVGEAVDANPNPDRAWVASGIVASLNPVDAPLSYVMAYRFRVATSRADIRADLNDLEAAVPAGAVANYASYLDFRDRYNFNNSLILTFLLAFVVLAVGAVAVIVANVVTGAVLANYREIGILKAIGFTPRQVVAVFVIQMLVPALAACLIAVPLGAIASKPLLDQAAEAISLPPPSPLVPIVDVLVPALGISVIAAAAALPAWRAGRLNAVDAITTGTAPLGRYTKRRVGWWRVPGQLSLGAGDAFARPVRGGLTAVAILVGVATLVFASGLYSAILKFNDLFAQPNFQVTVSRLGGDSDLDTNEVLPRQPETNPIRGVHQLAPNAKPIDYLVQLRPGTNVDAYVRQVSAAQPDFLFPQAISSGTGFNIEAILDAMVAALALILGAIAGLGVFNTLLLTTRERVRDIAILKALGMTPGQVTAMVTASAGVLGLVGGLLGIPAGIGLSRYLIDAMARLAGFSISSDTFTSAIDPGHLLLVALAGVLVALLGAILPARWAARTSVVNVLNLE